MDVLSVLEGSLHSRDEGEVPGMLLQWLHGGAELQRMDSGLVLDPFLGLGLVGVEPADEPGKLCFLFPGKKAAAVDAIGDVEHHHFLIRLLPFLEGLGRGQ